MGLLEWCGGHEAAAGDGFQEAHRGGDRECVGGRCGGVLGGRGRSDLPQAHSSAHFALAAPVHSGEWNRIVSGHAARGAQEQTALGAQNEFYLITYQHFITLCNLLILVFERSFIYVLCRLSVAILHIGL